VEGHPGIRIGSHKRRALAAARRGKTVYIGRRTGCCARMSAESLASVSLRWLPEDPGVKGRRLELGSCLSLESDAPVSLRWLKENQGEHCCQCGCGEAIRLQPRHYWRVPRYVHGHHNRRGHWRVLQLKEAGYLTTSDVARVLGIGTTTLRRREGTIYPRAAPDRRDPGVSRGGRRVTPTAGHGAAEGNWREIALARSGSMGFGPWTR
jgi:hypothetical protein